MKTCPREGQVPDEAIRRWEIECPVHPLVIDSSPGDDDEGGFILVFEVEDLGATHTPTLRTTENGQGYPQTQCHEVSLENAASPNRLILWGFSRVLRGATADSRHAWTVWRWRQS